MRIGNTPIVKLSDKLYGKLESVNPGGSIKDRPVKYILDDVEKRGVITAGDTIVEATSGNTGISLAMMCAERGYRCVIVMPSDMSIERKKMMKFFFMNQTTPPFLFSGGVVFAALRLVQFSVWAYFGYIHEIRLMYLMVTCNNQ